MTDLADGATTSLANLVDGLVAYLKEQPTPEGSGQSSVEGLARAFETFSHHLVALILVARSDDKVAATEREAILRHCANRAQMAGLKMTEAEESALADYLLHYRPTMHQLTPMLDRLKHDTKDEIAALIAAAHTIVQADGAVRLQEVAYLASLQHDLLAL